MRVYCPVFQRRADACEDLVRREVAQASNILCHHLDRTTGAFGNTKPAALAVVVLELEALTRPKFDHRIVWADAVAGITLKTVTTTQTSARLVQGICLVQVTEYFLEA